MCLTLYFSLLQSVVTCSIRNAQLTDALSANSVCLCRYLSVWVTISNSLPLEISKTSACGILLFFFQSSFFLLSFRRSLSFFLLSLYHSPFVFFLSLSFFLGLLASPAEASIGVPCVSGAHERKTHRTCLERSLEVFFLSLSRLALFSCQVRRPHGGGERSRKTRQTRGPKEEETIEAWCHEHTGARQHTTELLLHFLLSLLLLRYLGISIRLSRYLPPSIYLYLSVYLSTSLYLSICLNHDSIDL